VSFANSDCTVCKGEGLLRVDDLTTRMCLCAYARALAAHLGPEISKATSLKVSPFYVRSEFPGAPPLRDLTEENMFFRGTWDQLLPHFKYVLCLKGLDYRFKIVTDERLKSVFVGDTGYKARRGKTDNEEPINGLADLVNDARLLIIRLGFLGYKNVAMSGLLKEALMLREVARKPTWLVENPENAFVPGNHSYSEEVWSYITRNFDTSLDFTQSMPSVAEVVGVAASAPPPRPVRAVAVETLEEESAPSIAVEDVASDIDSAMAPKFKYGAPKKKMGGGSKSWKDKKPKMGDDFGGNE
jgi:hypothetical protein